MFDELTEADWARARPKKTEEYEAPERPTEDAVLSSYVGDAEVSQLKRASISKGAMQAVTAIGQWGLGGVIVVFIVLGISWAVRFATNAGIEGLVSHPISAAHAINSVAGQLEPRFPNLPAFVNAYEGSVAVEKSTPSGTWGYTIKWEGQSWKHDAKTTSLKNAWMNAVAAMGYFKDTPPPPIHATEFSIREPAGRTSVIGGKAKAAENLCILAIMLACVRGTSEEKLSPLMNVERGSLPYAVFFSGINEQLSLEEKIGKSCDSASNIRGFAAEMLASTLSNLPMDASGALDTELYESILTRLAEATTVEEKKKLYEQLCKSADVGQLDS